MPDSSPLPLPGSPIEECLTWLRREVVQWHGYGVVKVVRMEFSGRREGDAKTISGVISLDVCVRVIPDTIPAHLSVGGGGSSFSEAARDFAEKVLKSGGPLDGAAKELLRQTQAVAKKNHTHAAQVAQQWQDAADAYGEAIALVEAGVYEE